MIVWRNRFYIWRTKIKKDIVNHFFSLRKRNGLKVPFAEMQRMRWIGDENGIFKSKLLGKIIRLTNPYWYLHSLDEIFEQEIYKINFDKPNPYIIDCGANIGLSIIYLKRQSPQARILAFEADPIVFQQLEYNIQAFGFNDVALHNQAVWTNVGELTFYSEGALGGSLNDKLSSKARQVKVKTIRLKHYLQEPVDFLKVDIEGAEVDVIRDCAEELSNVQYLFLEFHSTPDKPQYLAELLKNIERAGFRYYIKEAAPVQTYPFLPGEFLFDLQLNIFCKRHS